MIFTYFNHLKKYSNVACQSGDYRNSQHVNQQEALMAHLGKIHLTGEMARTVGNIPRLLRTRDIAVC